NGILNVSAKDKATSKEQKITIKASSGLSKEDIERMVKDAEAHAEEDRKARELVDARNQAENLVHSSEKTLKELGDKVTGEERARVESAIRDLKEVVKKDDKSIIETKAQALAEASAKLAERLYAAKSEEAKAGDAQPQAQSGDSKGKDDVVDAEFEEVKDDKKQA
ncbi:MAG: Hsp70 family protein, partial [Gammaproteobacteria bacterium]